MYLPVNCLCLSACACMFNSLRVFVCVLISELDRFVAPHSPHCFWGSNKHLLAAFWFSASPSHQNCVMLTPEQFYFCFLFLYTPFFFCLTRLAAWWKQKHTNVSGLFPSYAVKNIPLIKSVSLSLSPLKNCFLPTNENSCSAVELLLVLQILYM